MAPLDHAAVAATAPVDVPLAGAAAVPRTSVRDYIALTKPRIIELLLVTTVPPMFLAAEGWPGGWLILATLLGGTLTAGAANVFNMVIDRDIDAVMSRTRDRPLPAHRITVGRAVAFGTVLGLVGPLWLWWAVNPLAAVLTAAAMAYYVGIYSAWLKRSTVQNIVIGGAAGAVPALVGWAAVTGTLQPGAWVLFAVVFLWTPPHFWSLAIVCDQDYARASVPMLPSVHGREETARRSLHYAAATVVCSLGLPLADDRVGLVYVAAALILGGLFLFRAVRLRRDPTAGIARRLFTFSITYLALLFGALVIDQLVRLPGA